MTYFLTLEDVTELGKATMAEEREEFLIAESDIAQRLAGGSTPA